MNIRNGVRAMLAVTGLAVASSSADAQVDFTQTYTLTPTESVAYVSFTVTTAGDFRFRTLATESGSDPLLFLFAGDPSAFGALLASDDDSCPTTLCPLNGEGSRLNSLIQRPLGLGAFTLAVSRFRFTEAEARAGVNPDITRPNVIPLVIDSENGSAALMSTVPEPSTYALMASGLLGIAAVSRRRRAV